jgi:hypothetical protein
VWGRGGSEGGVGWEGVDLAALAAEDCMKKGGVGMNMRLIRVEDCSLNINGKHNFVDTG